MSGRVLGDISRSSTICECIWQGGSVACPLPDPLLLGVTREPQVASAETTEDAAAAFKPRSATKGEEGGRDRERQSDDRCALLPWAEWGAEMLLRYRLLGISSPNLILVWTRIILGSLC